MFLHSNSPIFSRDQVHCHFTHEDVPDFPISKSIFFSKIQYCAIPLKLHVLYSTLNYYLSVGLFFNINYATIPFHVLFQSS